MPRDARKPRPANVAARTPGRRATPPAGSAATPGEPLRRPGIRSSLLWLLLGPFALLIQFWACRGGPLGVPVLDDYTFLSELRFQRPLDWLSPMGAPYYWRPVGRQLYFSLMGEGPIAHPWIVPLVHAALLMVFFGFAYRAARHACAPPLAALIAAFPLAAEPLRVPLGWASGGQHLLAMTGVAIAAHEALAGRRWSAGLAALAAVLSHESATFVLILLPLLAGWRERRTRALLGWWLPVGAVAAVSIAGHLIARSHGMSLPSDQGAGLGVSGLADVVGRGLAAQLNLEDRHASWVWVAGGAYLALMAAALVMIARRAKTARGGGGWWATAGGAAWFAAGAAPLALLLPDWNGWRTVIPSLGLGVALMALLGLASVRLAAACFTLRLALLALAPAAPAIVEARPPASVSQQSFPRHVRIQRTVESTRRALTGRFPRLPERATVHFWLIPALTEIGFQGPRAVRTWYRDATLDWRPFEGASGLGRPIDALVEYNAGDPWPATVIEPLALERFGEALESIAAGRPALADTQLTAAFQAQTGVSEPFFASLAYNQARVALALGDPARADSLLRLDLRWAGESGRTHAVAARIAAARGDVAGAERELKLALTLEPDNREAIALARELGFLPASP